MKAALVIALLALSACRWQGMQKPPPLGGRGGGGATAGGESVSDASVSQKTVTAKHAPATLVAFDGSRCVVTETRFRETVIGEKVWCVWGAAK